MSSLGSSRRSWPVSPDRLIGADVCGSFGYRRLATRVIHQALRDLTGASNADRETARRFLAGSPMLRFWCDLAQIRAAHVIARAATDWPVPQTPEALAHGEAVRMRTDPSRT